MVSSRFWSIKNNYALVVLHRFYFIFAVCWFFRFDDYPGCDFFAFNYLEQLNFTQCEISVFLTKKLGCKTDCFP